jgi:predicted aminopeptidase
MVKILQNKENLTTVGLAGFVLSLSRKNTLRHPVVQTRKSRWVMCAYVLRCAGRTSRNLYLWFQLAVTIFAANK